MNLVVRRSATRMWLMSIGSIPLLVVSIDILTNRKLTRALQGVVFPNPDDLQIYEPRDVIWAWALLLFAGFVVAWGLKELFMPTAVVEVRPAGLALQLQGPLRPPSLVDWGNLVDVSAIDFDDEGRSVAALQLVVLERSGLPANPWGARWLDERRLVVFSEDWDITAEEAARQIGDYSFEAVRQTPVAEEE